MGFSDRLLHEAISPIDFCELHQAELIHRAQKNAFTARLVTALLGRTSLIDPILIMTLHASNRTNLYYYISCDIHLRFTCGLFCGRYGRERRIGGRACGIIWNKHAFQC